MIDIHTHILPGMDDGAISMEETLDMARIAVASGVHTMIATPHCNVEGIFDNYYDDNYESYYHSVVDAFQREGINLSILPGMEVYGSEEVPGLLKQGKIITLNYSRYLLIEFSFHKDLLLIEYLINELTNLGIHPIIAHPERYPYVQKHPELLYEWVEQGCSIQVNKGSLLGSFGRNVKAMAHEILDNSLASFIASDAHGPERRTTDLSEVYQRIKYYYSRAYADLLLMENPKRVIEDQELLDPRRQERWPKEVAIRVHQ